MRLSNNICVGLVALGVAVATPAYGASLSFIPTGSQLDNDAINDIELNVGDSIGFTLELDTTGLSANLNSFAFLLERNRTELEFVNASFTDAFSAAFPNVDITIPSVTPETILALSELSGSGIPANSVLAVGVFNYTVLPGVSNDGLRDLAITLTSALDGDGADVLGLFGPVSQEIEVQASSVPEPTSFMGLLGLGALSAGALVKRRLVG